MWLIFLFGLFICSALCELNIPLCPSGGEPVCAKSDYEFIYFENECKLNVYSYQRLFAGKSRPTKIALEECFSNCAGIICPRLYQPVCAQQIPEGPASTVPNACLVNQRICETRKQWIILGNGPCPETMESGQSNNKAHSIPATSYEPTSSYQSSPDHESSAPVHATAHHIPTPYVPASNSAKYTHTLLASATSSDKYTISAYSSPVAAKETGTNSAPVSSYHVSGSKSQQISYTSSKQSATPLESSSYQQSTAKPVSHSSHISYAFGPAPYASGSPDQAPLQPTYEAGNESSSPSAAPMSPQNNFAESNKSPQESANYQQHEPTISQAEPDSYKSPVPAAVPSPSSYTPSAPTSVSYPSADPATSHYSSIKGSPVAAPAPAMYVGPLATSKPYLEASNTASPSAENAYQFKTSHAPTNSKNYEESAQTAPAHYENSQLPKDSPSPSYNTATSQPTAFPKDYQEVPQAVHYENSQFPIESIEPRTYSDDYQTAAQPDVTDTLPESQANAPYGNPLPAYYENSQPKNQASSAPQDETAYPTPKSNDYREENSQPIHYSSAPPSESYQAATPYQPQHSSDHQAAVPIESDQYGNSHTSNQGSQPTDSYPAETPSSEPLPHYYQGPLSTTETHENSQLSNQASSTLSESYPPLPASYPSEYSSEHKNATPTESDNYGNSQTDNQGSQPTADSYPAKEPHPQHYQGAQPTEKANYENSQPSSPRSMTVSKYYPQPPASNDDYQRPVENAPAQYGHSDQDREAVAYPSYATTHAPSTSTCTVGDHTSVSYVSPPAPEPIPALTAPIPTSKSYTSSESYHAAKSSSEGQGSAPVNCAGSEQNSAPPGYSNSPSEGSYANRAPVSTEPHYPESAPAPMALLVAPFNSVRYTPKEEESYTKDSSTPSQDIVAVSEQNSYKTPEVASDYASPSEENAQPVNHYKALDASTNTLPAQEAYAHPTPAANATYSAPEEYTIGETHPHMPNNKSSISLPAPYSYKNSNHPPSPSLNIYLAPAAAPAHASAPAVNVYTVPYRYPLATPSKPSLSIPKQPSLDVFKPSEEISEVYDPKLADLVSKWLDNSASSAPSTDSLYKLGVPFYYQPSFTLIQYNSAKSQYTKK